MMLENCDQFVLKPQREGGGNKYFRNDIKYSLKVEQYKFIIKLIFLNGKKKKKIYGYT